ncbi:hypothetical protein M1116_02305 [Patescibacteria group bacterium]|nr:hypothetical protein [Patescibacteria group bacterium]
MASLPPSTNRGQSIVDLVIAMGLCAVLLPALITGLVASRNGKAQQQQRDEATTLLKEAEEAVRSIKEKSWDDLVPIGSTLHLARAGTGWSLAASPETINGFTRSITIHNVYRDSNFNIIGTGTSDQIDPSTKEVAITVSWSQPIPATSHTDFYLTRYLGNKYYEDTSVADFNAVGTTQTNVQVTNILGGEVILGPGNLNADWCQPNLTVTTVDLPKNGVANAISAIPANGSNPAYAFAGTGDNASGVSFAKVNITDTNPPQASIPNPGTFDGFKTNAVFGEANYAYLGTDNNSKEIEIINLQTNPYSEAGYFNAPGNGNGNAIYVANNIGYMASGNKFYTFDLSSRIGNRGNPLNNGHVTTLAGTATKIRVINYRAYISENSTSRQMEIIDVSNPANPSVIGQAVSLNDQGATDIFINDTETRAYLVTSASSTKNDLFVLDISTHTGNRPVLTSYNTNGMSPKGVIEVMNDQRLIAVGIGGTEYQVYSYNDSTHTISLCGPGVNVDSGINGVAAVTQPSGNVYSYIITGDATAELKIIAGGPGGSTLYATIGYFYSRPFDSTNPVVYNRFFANTDTPTGTTITFKLAAAPPGSSGCSNANYQFVGPDLSINTTYPGSSFIPWSNGPNFYNPARCFRYEAILSGDGTHTPTLYDFTVNYSP